MVSTFIRQATNPADVIKRNGNKIRRNHVEGILVVTSEEIIEIPSIMNRVIFLDVNKFPIGEKMLRFMEQHPSFPVEISLLIIEDIARDLEGYKSLIIDKMSLHMNEERINDGNSRCRRNYMCLRTVWDVVLKVAENRGVDLSGEPYIHVQSAMKEIMDYHATILGRLDFQKDSYAPIRILFDAILTIENRDIFDAPVEGEIEYEKKNGCFYLLPEEAVRYLLRETGQPYTDRKLSPLLSAMGALRKDKSKKSTKKYNNIRHWVLDRAAVEAFMEGRG